MGHELISTVLVHVVCVPALGASLILFVHVCETSVLCVSLLLNSTVIGMSWEQQGALLHYVVPVQQ